LCRECGADLPPDKKEGIAAFFCSAACMIPAAFWAVTRGYASPAYAETARKLREARRA